MVSDCPFGIFKIFFDISIFLGLKKKQNNFHTTKLFDFVVENHWLAATKVILIKFPAL
jgi:hypothetical protein